MRSSRQRLPFRDRRFGKALTLFTVLLLPSFCALAQTTFPVNGVADPREKCYAFTHATLVKDGGATIADATLVIRDGLIVSAGAGITPPKDAVVVDCSGKYIYPSFIDLYSDYGIPEPEGRGARGANPFDFFRAPAQMNSNTKGAYNWNQAVHPETDASRI